MAKKATQHKPSAHSKKQQRLLLKLAQFAPSFTLGNYEVSLLDLHYFPGHVNKSSTEHLHSFVEFHIPLKGAGHIYLNDKKHAFSPGTFTITAPEQVHEWIADETPMMSHIWWFQVKQLGEETNKDIKVLFDALLDPPKPVQKLPPEYMMLYDSLIQELGNTRLCYQTVCNNLIENILLVLGRAMISSRRKKTLVKNADEAPQDHIVKLVNSFLEDNLSQPLLLDDIAKIAHISRRNLTRHYKKAAGITIGQKLHEMRMYRAEELVRETNMKIKTITFKCGFLHLSHFAKNFKEFFGYTPTEYREKIKNESVWDTTTLPEEKLRSK